MAIPPAPEPVSCVVHGLRAAGWVVVLELATSVGVFGVASAGWSALGWVGLAVVLDVAVGLALGLALDRVPAIRARPPLACALIGAAFLALAAGEPGSAFAVVGGTFAWSRWRFPGQPSAIRSAVRALFFGGLVVGFVAYAVTALGTPSWNEGAYEDRPNVLVVVLDTVRRDHLSTYGYHRLTSPRLDELAARGAVWDGFSNATWSLPSHATVLTGLHSGGHGTHYEDGTLDDVPTLPDAFGEAGYDTLCITANPWVNQENGLASGFGTHLEAWGRLLVPSAFAVLRRVRPLLFGVDDDKGGAWGAGRLGAWLDARPDPERPFFALVNIIEAHVPYQQVPERHRRAFLPDSVADDVAWELGEDVLSHHLRATGAPEGEALSWNVDLYDGAIRAADEVLGMHLDALQARGLSDDTVVIVTADHGEYLGEHELWGHLHGLYEPVLSVPFVVAGPGVPRGRQPGPAQLIDVAPTVFALTGVAGFDTHGRDARTRAPEHAVVAEQYTPYLVSGKGEQLVGDLDGFAVRRRSVRVGEHKLRARADGDAVAHDLTDDPQEGRALEADPGLLLAEQAWMATTGIAWPDGRGTGPLAEGLDVEALRALGYVE